MYYLTLLTKMVGLSGVAPEKKELQFRGCAIFLMALSAKPNV